MKTTTKMSSDELALNCALPASIVHKLGLVCAQRRAESKIPNTKKDIVRQALEQWFRKNTK